jgi:hypothetical protein
LVGSAGRELARVARIVAVACSAAVGERHAASMRLVANRTRGACVPAAAACVAASGGVSCTRAASGGVSCTRAASARASMRTAAGGAPATDSGECRYERQCAPQSVRGSSHRNPPGNDHTEPHAAKSSRRLRHVSQIVHASTTTSPGREAPAGAGWGCAANLSVVGLARVSDTA